MAQVDLKLKYVSRACLDFNPSASAFKAQDYRCNVEDSVSILLAFPTMSGVTHSPLWLWDRLALLWYLQYSPVCPKVLHSEAQPTVDERQNTKPKQTNNTPKHHHQHLQTLKTASLYSCSSLALFPKQNVSTALHCAGMISSLT